MDKLHLAHIGFKLPIAVFPPLLSGMLCPTWKLKQLILLRHQLIGHFTRNLFLLCLIHTCSLNAFGILFFFFFDDIFSSHYLYYYFYLIFIFIFLNLAIVSLTLAVKVFLFHNKFLA